MVPLKNVVKGLFMTTGPSIGIVFEGMVIPVPPIIIVRSQERKANSFEQVKADLEQL